MLRLRRAVMVAVVSTGLLATPAVASDPELVIEGAGFGHGVGLSQWGAKGLADAGWTAEQILTHYYTGGAAVELLSDKLPEDHEFLTDPHPMWVNVRQSLELLEFEALDDTLTICANGQGGCIYQANPGEAWQFLALGDGTCQFLRDGEAVTEPDACQAKIKGMRPDGARLDLADVPARPDLFARGEVRIRTPDDGMSFHVVLTIDLEDYLYGISEVFYSWPAAALEAQAVAARSFGVYQTLVRGPHSEFDTERKELCWCHLFSDTRSQNYEGWRNETAASADKWLQAVDATVGRVVTHPTSGQFDIAETSYSAANGGASENNEDIFGTGALPWLRSVDDPWTLDAAGNPHSSWSFAFTEAALQEVYSVDRVDGLAITDVYDSGTPKQITLFSRIDGEPNATFLTAAELKNDLGLRGRHVDSFDYGAIGAVAGDFNGDSVDDVAMFMDFNDAWWVGEGNGLTFDMSPWSNFGPTEGWRDPLVGDFTGDGRDDVAVYRDTTGAWVVGTSKSSGKFLVKKWGSHANTPDVWQHGTVGDFDGDGRDDLADYNTTNGRVRVYLSAGTTFTSSRWHTFFGAPAWTNVVAGDFDGDGRDDLAFQENPTGAVTVLFSDGATFAKKNWPLVGDVEELLVGDLNDDDRDDLVGLDRGTSTWTVVLAGSDRTGSVEHWAEGDPAATSLVAAGDFSGDGNVDVSYVDPITGVVTVLVSDGASFDAQFWGVNPAASDLSSAHVIDVGNDGTADLAVWSESRRKWWTAVSDGASFAVTARGRLLA